MAENILEEQRKPSWFEFLLDEDLLEQHLKNENADPPAHSLIGLFLYQAEIAINTAKDLVEKDNQTNNEQKTEGDPPSRKTSPGPVDSKKARALRLLAIKVVAYLDWNLDILNRKVPDVISHEVLQELLRISTPPDKAAIPHSQLDLTTLTDEMFFAIYIFYRWCVRTVVRESFFTKPSKVINVQVPGLLDPTLSTAAAKENLIKMVQEGMEDSIAMLERLLEANRAVRIPTIHCFEMLNENTNIVNHDWHKGLLVSVNEIRCQLCYDLACAHFQRSSYERAGQLFLITRDLMKELGESKFCHVDKDRLKGYCAACGIVADSLPSLHTQIEATRKNLFQGLVPLLQEDNRRQEVSLQFRLSLEEDIKALLPRVSPKQLSQVQACNVVRRLQLGQPAPGDFLSSLHSAPKDTLLFFIQVCEDVLQVGSDTQRTSIRDFLRYVCQLLPDNKTAKEHLSQYFNMEEWEELGRLHSQSQHKALSMGFSTKSKDPMVCLGELEDKLLRSYDAAEIKTIIGQLKEKLDRPQVLSLSEKWGLPRDMRICLDGLNGQDHAFAHILIAKAKLCSDLKLYEKVRDLLQKADSIVKDTSYNLSRLIKWEILLVDFQQYHQYGTFSSDQSLKDLAKKAKTCITSMQQEQDMRPRPEIVANCSAFLLMMKDWDYLISLDSQTSGFLQFSRLIGALCKELRNIKGARKAARELWEAVVLVFTNSMSQKRNNSGAPLSGQRQASRGILSQREFIVYLRLIQEPVALSAMVSCLTKLYNILKHDILSEISSDYIILWPTTLGSEDGLNIPAVTEAVTCVMEHALTVDPSQPSWLRTQADIHYAHSQYAQALKFYIEAGVVATDFFSEPVPKSVLDDTVYKRMIKCCSYLQCHTQVAVLCQFLEEIDYSTAFKAFQERNNHDAMDVYYDCFWDVTMLEYLVNLHTKRGENKRRQMAISAIGQPELNSSNPPEILQEAARLRKTRFLQALAKQYL